MTKLTLSGFRGAVLARHPRELPESNGTSVINLCELHGDLRPWHNPLTTATVPAARQTIYRMGRDAPSDASYWLSWTTHVDVIRGLNPTDTAERTIFTGSGVPSYTDNTMALATSPYPTAVRPLGVPAPTAAPTIALNTAGPAGPTPIDVVVVVTFVTDRSEEGSISPVSNKLTVQPGSTLDVTGLPAFPSGNYGFNRYRIYASSSGNTSASYQFAGEFASGTSTATIDLSNLGGVLETGNYDMPPADGHSIVSLWQFAAMASGKSVRFCEVGLIYAWPLAYRQLTADTVVGLGTFDQTLVVLTTGRPLLIQGSGPSTMQQQQVPLDQACVSAAGIVSFGAGVVWPSPDGLFMMTNAGPINLTDKILNRSDWQALAPSTIVAEQHQGLYIANYTVAGVTKAFIINPAQPDGIIFLSAGYAALHRDDIQAALFVLSTTNVQKWDAADSFMTATFTTKVHRLPSSTSFSCAKLVADSFGQTVRFYADGVLKFTKTVNNGKAFRLPIGFRGQDWQFSIDTTVPVQALLVADDFKEVDS
jgi:hypothetical protein